jgi:hypothetical protein
MRSNKTLVTLLRKLADLLASEAARNTEFGDRLDELLGDSSRPSPSRHAAPRPDTQLKLPDIHAEWIARGETEFELWLRDQPIATLRALIRRHDLDATRRTSKWRDTEKLSAYIAAQLRSRSARGSSFLRGGATE